ESTTSKPESGVRNNADAPLHRLGQSEAQAGCTAALGVPNFSLDTHDVGQGKTSWGDERRRDPRRLVSIVATPSIPTSTASDRNLAGRGRAGSLSVCDCQCSRP